MALDIKAMQAQFNKLNKTVSATFFKPEEGEQTIRIVPFKKNPANPFTILYFHYGIPGRTLLSPLSYGERDPISEFSDALVGEGGLSKEDYKAAKKFSPSPRTYVPIVVRGKESEGVKFWGFGKTTYQDLFNVMTDEDYGDITDPQSGRDIKLTFTPAKDKNSFAKTDLLVKPKESPLATDKKLLDKLLNDQPDLMAEFDKHSYEDLENILASYLKAADRVADAPSGDASGDDDSEQETPTPPALTGDVEEEFNKIFDQD